MSTPWKPRSGQRRVVKAVLAVGVIVLAIAARVAFGQGGPGTTGFDANGTFLLAGQPFFPIVLSKPPPLDGTTPSGSDGLDAIVRGGVNMLKVGPATVPWTDADIADAKAWDEAALGRGVHTWINLSTLAQAKPGSRGEALLRKVVTELQRDRSGRAIGMWKGADEPWWGGVPPSALRFAYCLVTGRGDPSWCAGEQPLDGEHLWVTIEAPRGSAQDLAPYSAVTDTHGVDVYPVSLRTDDPDLHRVGTWTHTIDSITPDHSVWTTLEICFTGSYDASGNYVLPTRLQERYMIYDAIINGARGLNFYGGNNPGCWNATDRAHGWSWTFWTQTLQPLVEEIDRASPLWPALIHPGSTQQLSTSDSTTEAISRRGSRGDLWVLAARSGSGSENVTITGLPHSISSGSVDTENRTVAIHDGSFTDSFGRWNVHVYRFSTG